MFSRSLTSILQLQVRAVSSKYPKPTPRHYKRRLYEAALKPELPQTAKTCVSPDQAYRQKIQEGQKYSEVELALAKLVKQWLTNEEFRVLAVCQFLPVPGRTLWFAKNQLRMKNIEFRSYGNKILKNVFEGTPMSSLDVVLVGSNAILLGKDINSIKSIIQEADKLNWIEPLVIMADNRIISMEEARKLSKLSSMEDLRVETSQLLGQQVAQLSLTLDQATRHLPTLLDIYQQNQK